MPFIRDLKKAREHSVAMGKLIRVRGSFAFRVVLKLPGTKEDSVRVGLIIRSSLSWRISTHARALRNHSYFLFPFVGDRVMKSGFE